MSNFQVGVLIWSVAMIGFICFVRGADSRLNQQVRDDEQAKDNCISRPAAN